MILTGEVIKEPYVDLSIVDDPELTKYIDVMIHPEGQIIRRVQLPRTTAEYKQPQLGSMVLVFRPNVFDAKMISIIKDPVNKSNVLVTPLRGEGQSGSDNFKPGEIQYESKGRSFLYLDNNGSAKLSAADSTEQFVADVGAQTAYVKGINVIFSNSPSSLNIIMDKDGNLTLQQVTPTQVPAILASIKIAKGGKITVNSAISDVEVSSSTGKVTINAAQEVSIAATTDININATANINITASKNVTIRGVAVKLGTLTKKLVTETFMSLFNAHMHPTAAFGPPSPPAILMTSAHTTQKTEGE